VRPLRPIDSILSPVRGREWSLPAALRRLYGPLRMATHSGRPHVMANFAATLDGVVSLNSPGESGGGEITGTNPHDRLIMGLLRSTADAVVVGAGTQRSVPRHLWTASHVFPDLAKAFAELRSDRGMAPTPLNVIVSAHGDLDLTLPVFQSGKVEVLIVTTGEGSRALSVQQLPASVRIARVQGSNHLSARAVLREVQGLCHGRVILVEGGPHLLGDFLFERALDELFLTVAPQIAGRDSTAPRPGLVAGREFAPADPLWPSLVGIQRAGGFLFLRYSFVTVVGARKQSAPRAIRS